MQNRTIEQITVVVAVSVLGIALSIGVSGIPLVILTFALIVTVNAGLDLVLRGESRTRSTPEQFVLPTATVLGALVFLPLLPTGTQFVLGLGGTGTLLFLNLWVEWSLSRGKISTERGETILAGIGYITAFILFGGIYQTRARSIISATAIVTVATLLALRHLRLTQVAFPDRRRPADEPPDLAGLSIPERLRLSGQFPVTRSVTVTTSGRHIVVGPPWDRVLTYACVTGLCVGEVTWALNYWPLNGLQGGAVILAVYYFITGILTYALHTRLRARVTVEYGTIALAAVAIISLLGLAPRQL